MENLSKWFNDKIESKEADDRHKAIKGIFQIARLMDFDQQIAFVKDLPILNINQNIMKHLIDSYQGNPSDSNKAKLKLALNALFNHPTDYMQPLINDENIGEVKEAVKHHILNSIGEHELKKFTTEANPPLTPSTLKPFFAKEMSSLNDYIFLGKKAGGVHDPGPEGGEYMAVYLDKNSELHTTKLLFKQDTQKNRLLADKTNHHKDITEIVAGSILNKLIGDSASSVFLANGNSQNPDEDKAKNVYVGSIFYEGFKDLFKELYQRYNKRHTDSPIEIPEDRPRFLNIFDNFINDYYTTVFRDAIYESGSKERTDLKDLEKVYVAPMLLGDFDTHGANIGVVGDRLVDIDHGEALKKLTKDFNPHSRTEHLPGIGPTNHFRELPRNLRVTPAMAEECERIGHFNEVELKKSIQDGIDEAVRFYGEDSQAFLDFMQHIGVDKEAFIKANPHFTGEGNAAITTQFLSNILAERQVTLLNYALEIRLSLLVQEKPEAFGLEAKNQEAKLPEVKQEALVDDRLNELINSHPNYFASFTEGHYRAKIKRGTGDAELLDSSEEEQADERVKNKVAELLDSNRNPIFKPLQFQQLNRRAAIYVLALKDIPGDRAKNICQLLESQLQHSDSIHSGHLNLLMDQAHGIVAWQNNPIVINLPSVDQFAKIAEIKNLAYRLLDGEIKTLEECKNALQDLKMNIDDFKMIVQIEFIAINQIHNYEQLKAILDKLAPQKLQAQQPIQLKRNNAVVLFEGANPIKRFDATLESKTIDSVYEKRILKESHLVCDYDEKNKQVISKIDKVDLEKPDLLRIMFHDIYHDRAKVENAVADYLSKFNSISEANLKLFFKSTKVSHANKAFSKYLELTEYQYKVGQGAFDTVYRFPSPDFMLLANWHIDEVVKRLEGQTTPIKIKITRSFDPHYTEAIFRICEARGIECQLNLVGNEVVNLKPMNDTERADFIKYAHEVCQLSLKHEIKPQINELDPQQIQRLENK